MGRFACFCRCQPRKFEEGVFRGYVSRYVSGVCFAGVFSEGFLLHTCGLVRGQVSGSICGSSLLRASSIQNHVED